MTEQMTQSTYATPNRTASAQDNGKSYLYLIFDTFDPLRLQASCLKPEMVERVVLVQDLGDRDLLYALMPVFKRNLAALVPAGALHLDPAHPHRRHLDTFRDWLDTNGIDQRELRFAEPGSYQNIVTQGVVRLNSFSSREDLEVRKLFSDWRIQGNMPYINV